MKKVVLLLLTLLSISSYAQEQGKIRASLDLGYAKSSGSNGVSIYLEPMYNIEDNISIGVRIGTPILVKKIELFNEETIETAGNTNLTFIATVDYHFNKINSSIIPFIGGGIGYASINNVSYEPFSNIDGKTQYVGKINGMIRGGFEWKKLRFSIDYNLIPKSDFIDVNNDKVGYSKNSYFGFNIGFFVGGGKW